jgi:hypothetical protein
MNDSNETTEGTTDALCAEFHDAGAVHEATGWDVRQVDGAMFVNGNAVSDIIDEDSRCFSYSAILSRAELARRAFHAGWLAAQARAS